MTICCVLSLGMFMQVMNEKLLAATSRTTLSMISQLVGAIVNICLLYTSLAHTCGLDCGQDAHPDIAGCGPQAVALKQAPRTGDGHRHHGHPRLCLLYTSRERTRG